VCQSLTLQFSSGIMDGMSEKWASQARSDGSFDGDYFVPILRCKGFVITARHHTHTYTTTHTCDEYGQVTHVYGSLAVRVAC
jgi:hypothetical protein